jgi:opacity protein-like surface antigen
VVRKIRLPLLISIFSIISIGIAECCACDVFAAEGRHPKEKNGASRDVRSGGDSRGGREGRLSREARGPRDNADTSSIAEELVPDYEEWAPSEDTLVALTLQGGAGFFSSGEASSIPVQATAVLAVGVRFPFGPILLEPRAHLQMMPISFEAGAAGAPTPGGGALSSGLLVARLGYAITYRASVHLEAGAGMSLLTGLSSAVALGTLRTGLSVELGLARNLDLVVTPVALTWVAESASLQKEVGAIQRADVLIGATYRF